LQKRIVKRCNINANSALAWPGGFPPVSTVRSHFHACRDSGLLATVNQLVVTAAREMEGRQAGSANRRHHRLSERQIHRKLRDLRP
jgi:hypothetical protein